MMAAIGTRVGGKNVMPAAIGAVDMAFNAHIQKHARMAERPVAAVAIQDGRFYGYGF